VVFRIISDHPKLPRNPVLDEALQDSALIQSSRGWRGATISQEDLIKKIHELRESFSSKLASEQHTQKIKDDIKSNYDRVGIGMQQSVDLIGLLDLL
jgi:hypothetical protein